MASSTDIYAETRTMVSLTLPYMLQLYAVQFVNRVTLAFVGHYDPEPTNIAAATLGTMWSGITGLSIGVGMMLALGFYCSRNYGQGMSTENGIVVWHCLRAEACCFIFAVSMAGVSAPLLGALGQPVALLEPVQRFSLISTLALPPYWMTSVFSTALASQCCQMPGTIAQLLSTSCNFCLAWAFLANGVGYLGIAFANVLSAWLGLLFMTLYVVRAKKQSVVWRIHQLQPDSGTVQGPTMREYVQTALPSALTMWAEWWAAEILALFAGLLPDKTISVAANGILFNTLAIFYMTFVAVSRASSMRVGHLLGAKTPDRIKLCIVVALSFTVLLSGVVCLILIGFGTSIVRMYTPDEQIIAEAASANVGMALSVLPYSVMMCMVGVLRSSGHQLWGAIALFVSFYIVGIPTGAFLGLVAGVGLPGIWIGNVVSLSVSAILTGKKVFSIDWLSIVTNSGVADNAVADIERMLSDPLSGSTPCTPVLLVRKSPSPLLESMSPAPNLGTVRVCG